MVLQWNTAFVPSSIGRQNQLNVTEFQIKFKLSPNSLNLESADIGIRYR
ncbi:hypothetical protein RSSM_02187 [Rhodopirellula sallentina SM41]|uniref:Uncharacterized protein n=1 Tax=Rhodopirellula sallentina SM41 TaxID=1263870 RepID=M5U4K6_9BACT|nr:hypothetical protein RSSM_02187 [Rhodopirellula sallentina SM41]